MSKTPNLKVKCKWNNFKEQHYSKCFPEYLKFAKLETVAVEKALFPRFGAKIYIKEFHEVAIKVRPNT